MSRNNEYDVVKTTKRSRGRVGCCRDSDLDSDADHEKPRGCTDIIFLLVYVIFSLVMVVIAIFAAFYGNPLRLINGSDSFGNICGMNNDGNMTFTGMDMREKPFVFFLNLEHMNTTTKICVQQCPDVEIRTYADLHQFYVNTSVSLCQYDYDLDSLKNNSQPRSGGIIETLCPKLPYPSSYGLLKRCIPKPDDRLSVLIKEVYEYLNSLDNCKQILGDLAVTWPIVLGLTVAAFGISFGILCSIHWITKATSYIIFIATSVLSIVFTIVLWWTYVNLDAYVKSQPTDQVLSQSEANKITFLILSIISTIWTITLHLIMIYLRRRILIVAQLFREAGRAIREMPCLLIQPVITYVLLTIFFLGWLLIVLCLATADYESRNTVSLVAPGSESEMEAAAAAAHISLDDSGHDYDVHLNESLQMSKNRTVSAGDISVTSIDYSEEVWVKYMWWIYLIGLIWCSEFILSCQQMVIASAVSSWYFSRDRTKLKWVITRSVRRLVKYHLGSMALGSLVITVVKVPRLIFSFLQRVLRKWEDRTCIKWVTKGCTICLSCFESWLKYVHHNAYTVIAIQCINFCPASRLAFSALLGNALQISVVNSIGDFVLFLAKCSTAALTGVIAIILFRNQENVYFYAVPVILTVLFAYFVAHSVISVFEMAVDTLFLCFCEDHNMNAETQNFYAPSSLLQYMRVDAPHVLAMRYDCDAGPIPVKQSFEETATAEERYPMNVIHRT